MTLMLHRGSPRRCAFLLPLLTLLLMLTGWTRVSMAMDGTETLIGICGRDFVLLAADAVANSRGSAFLTSSDLDKIAIFSDASSDDETASPRIPVTAVAAVGDTADADRLVTRLRSAYNVALYEHCHDYVTYVDAKTGHVMDRSSPWDNSNRGIMTVHSVAQSARHLISHPVRGKPYHVALLVAGMVKVTPKWGAALSATSSPLEERQRLYSVARHVQHQLVHATAALQSREAPNAPETDSLYESSRNESSVPTLESSRRMFTPVLYWIDEYGAVQRVPYAAHGGAARTLWSVLDRGYRDDLTLHQALQLMRDCLAQLRTRYAVNTHHHFCVKCLDAHGCRVMDLESETTVRHDTAPHGAT